MAVIFEFPQSHVRNWREMERTLREIYKDFPDGPVTIASCMEKLKFHWEEIFVSFDTSLTYNIPGVLSDEQLSAVRDAVERAQNLVFEKMKTERLKFFGKLVMAEYEIASIRKVQGS